MIEAQDERLPATLPLINMMEFDRDVKPEEAVANSLQGQVTVTHVQNNGGA